MSVEDFFDSNVLLYLLSDDPVKNGIAEGLLQNGGTISIQVLNEIASVALGKFGKPLSGIRELLHGIRAVCTVQDNDIATHEQGLDIAERYKFSIYDSMLLASALQAGCRTFYSEDLHHGQRIGSLTIRNPFRA
jgi:predicted nucleic acid-binding protein